MAGKKDQSVVATIHGLTSTQAANIQRDIIKAKDKHAPNARATMAKGNTQDVGRMLDVGNKTIEKIESK